MQMEHRPADLHINTRVVQNCYYGGGLSPTQVPTSPPAPHSLPGLTSLQTTDIAAKAKHGKEKLSNPAYMAHTSTAAHAHSSKTK
jgi:hypothetical protein